MSLRFYTQCNIVTSDKDIVAYATKDLARRVTSRLRGIENDIRLEIMNLIREAITTSSVYIALTSPGGRLRTELGIIQPQADLDRIISKMLDGITVTPLRTSLVGTTFSANLVATAVRDDFADLLNSGEGQYLSKNTQGKQTLVEWLKWLLTKGNAMIIVGYDIRFNLPQYSRTDDAIMVKNRSKSWFVPADYAGTLEDNFITRALNESKANERLANFILRNVKSRL